MSSQVIEVTIPAEAGKTGAGETLDFECENNWVSYWVSKSILEGETYPVLPFVDDVHVVCDVGANCGATTVHFAHHYPAATVHAFEPGYEQRLILERNASRYANVQVQPIGLHAEDMEAQLYAGDGSSITSSLTPGECTIDQSETVETRSALGWAQEHEIEGIDILKVDVEGCEVEVLQSLEPLLPTVKALYVEYDSWHARRAIDELLADTHELLYGRMFLQQGECIYLSRTIANAHLDTAKNWLAHFVFANKNRTA